MANVCNIKSFLSILQEVKYLQRRLNRAVQNLRLATGFTSLYLRQTALAEYTEILKGLPYRGNHTSNQWEAKHWMWNVAFVVLPVTDISVVTNTCFETTTEEGDIFPSMKNVKKYKSSMIDLKRMRKCRFCMVWGASFGILKTLRHGQRGYVSCSRSDKNEASILGCHTFPPPSGSGQLF